jgi:prepilin-type N-terminal cleavage/methylation domain-containing protein
MGQKNAFTLVELAIVIVIIGLLVGGVLAGQELIKQARWRTLYSNIESYKAAHYGFVAKYNDWPGDSVRHSLFFPGAGIAEGNGNKTIDWFRETYEYWRALSLAKLVKGTYSGNVPAIQSDSFPKDGSNYNYIYKCAQIDSHRLWGDPNACYYNASNFPPTTSWQPHNVGYPIFTAMEAFEFDNKFDDGIPSSGNIKGYRPTPGGVCTDVDAFSGTQTGIYNTTHANANKALGCSMGFIFNP